MPPIVYQLPGMAPALERHAVVVALLVLEISTHVLLFNESSTQKLSHPEPSKSHSRFVLRIGLPEIPERFRG